MKYLELREIQLEELSILKELTHFLDKNNIKYYLAAGSLLGAVRHKGFIPWDDDIDVYVTRPEFEKIVEIAKENPYIDENKKLEIVYCELNTSVQPFIKINNNDILIDEDVEIDKYLWVDVFPMDGIPEDEATRKKYFKDNYTKHWDILLKHMKYKHIFICTPDKKMAFKRVFRKFILTFKDKEALKKEYVQRLKQYDFNTCKYIANAGWTDPRSYYLVKDTILEQALYDFEDIKITSFKDFDTVLRAEYGDDYMTPPPENKRKSHFFKAYYKKDKLEK